MFYRVNVTITAVWAATFTVLTIATAIVRASRAGTAATVAVYACSVPIAFTRRYPGIMRAHYAS